MTTLKFESKVAAAASEALEPHVRPLYDQPGLRLMAIVEMATTERTQPAPGSDKTPTVKVRITGLEIPNPEQEGAVREAQRFLFLQRTAHGTFDDDGQLELSESTLRLTGGMLAFIETARLRAALTHWINYSRRVVNGPDLTVTETKFELAQIADGLAAALATARGTDDS